MLQHVSDDKVSIIRELYTVPGYVHINGHDRTIIAVLAKHCIKLPDDGYLVIRNMLEHF